MKLKQLLFSTLLLLLLGFQMEAQKKIVQDAEYYIIEAQNGERWQEEDKALDKKLQIRSAANRLKATNNWWTLLKPVYEYIYRRRSGAGK